MRAHVVTKSSSLTSWPFATGFPMTVFLHCFRLATVTVGMVISLRRSTTKTIRNGCQKFVQDFDNKFEFLCSSSPYTNSHLLIVLVL